jgi:hypothetical protein
MAKKSAENKNEVLKGWAAIAEFLGQTPAVAQRWHNEGMPITKDGRFVYANPEDLTQWVGTDSGQWVGTESDKRKPVHISSENENLTADLKEGLSYFRRQRDNKA